MESIFEVVSFRCKAGVEKDAFRAAARTSQNWVARQPGFVRRHVVADGDGNYVDVVEWASREEAMAADRQFAAAAECRPVLEMIDRETVRMFHGAPILEG